MKEEKVRKIVRKRYGNVAKNSSSCCASSDSSCGCTPVTSGDISRKIGYSEEEARARAKTSRAISPEALTSSKVVTIRLSSMNR